MKICVSPSDWLICLGMESSESSSEQAQLDLGLACPLSHWLKICLSPSDWLICHRSESSESSSEQAQLGLGGGGKPSLIG